MRPGTVHLGSKNPHLIQKRTKKLMDSLALFLFDPHLHVDFCPLEGGYVPTFIRICVDMESTVVFQ